MNKTPERWLPSSQPGDKFCTQCKSLCPAQGGVQLVMPDKLHQRWICKRCKDHREEALLKAGHS